MRETFSERLDRLRPHIGFLLVILILVGGGVWAFSESRRGQEAVETVKSEEPQVQETDEIEVPKIAVDVAGAVASPGVYELPEGARITDALDRAGGLSAEADQGWLSKNLNLAAKLSDGDKIYIPAAGEPSDQTSAPASVPVSPPPAGLVESSSCSRVNINKASVATLDECLPGIGPAYAQRIVDYRQSHGGFKSVEEIQQVSGIGPKTFEKIKDQITIE